MDFVTALKAWTVGKLVEVLGVPERTVYSWRMGDRLPPEWVQKLILDRMKRVKPDASSATRSSAESGANSS